jgi:hypothetical protein
VAGKKQVENLNMNTNITLVDIIFVDKAVDNVQKPRFFNLSPVWKTIFSQISYSQPMNKF